MYFARKHYSFFHVNGGKGGNQVVETTCKGQGVRSKRKYLQYR